MHMEQSLNPVHRLSVFSRCTRLRLFFDDIIIFINHIELYNVVTVITYLCIICSIYQYRPTEKTQRDHQISDEEATASGFQASQR